MKMKGSSRLTVKTAGVTGAVLFALLFVLRLYQTMRLTDPATGFFTDRSNFTVPVFYVLAIGSVLVTVLLTFLAKKETVTLTENKRDIPHAVTSLLFAASLVLAFKNGFGVSPYTEEGRVNYVAKLIPAFALLTAAVLLVNFISFISGKMIVGKIKILSLIPALWGFFVTINYFTVTASYIRVTQLMLTIFADAFLMLFLLEYARYVSGIGIADAVWAFYATGIVASSLLLVTEIPNLIFRFFMNDNVIVNCEFRFFNLAAALFVITAMCNAAKNMKKTEA